MFFGFPMWIEITLIVGFFIALALAFKFIPGFNDLNWSKPETPAGLQEKFISLGEIKGKSKKEIEDIVGSPNSFSAVSDTEVLYQRMEGGYHIALIFDATDVCQGISHECSV